MPSVIVSYVMLMPVLFSGETLVGGGAVERGSRGEMGEVEVGKASVRMNCM